MNISGVYLVTDRASLSGKSLEDVVLLAVKGGATMVQLREKNISTRIFIEEARRIRKILAPYRVPLIINDRVDVALAAGADGVHIGQEDMPYPLARKLMGPGAIIGLSVETPDQVEAAEALDVAYLGVSAIFATPTKTDTRHHWGIDGLRKVRAMSRHPLVAIGGINAANAAEVMQAGADSLAVVSAICSATDPQKAAENLQRIILGIRHENQARISPDPKRGQSACAKGRAMKYYRLLTIAGSDSSGGAGIQADLKTFSALGCYGMSVICALTAQNTRAVTGIYPVSPEFISLQIDAIMEDIGVDAVKIGMLHSPEVIDAVTERLKYYKTPNIVVDPVMVSTGGDKLLQDDAVDALKTILFPIATVITPNLPEAAMLLNQPIEALLGAERAQLETVCKNLSAFGPQAVVLKGGHGKSHQILDLLYTATDDRLKQFETTRIDTRNTHGTGCTLSAAIAAHLAKGHPLEDALLHAKIYITDALKAGAAYQLGNGHGPVHHFHGYWL